ncbi:hypothetical protein PS6_011640 [Mucor atramentarius]
MDINNTTSFDNTLKALVKSVKSLHARLDIFEQAQQAQQALSEHYCNEINGPHTIINNLEEMLNRPSQATALSNCYTAPNATNANTTATPPAANTSQCTKVVKNTPAQSPAVSNKNVVATLLFHLFNLLALTMPLPKDIQWCTCIVLIKRILDVSFPARNTAAILIHEEFLPNTLTVQQDFDPTDANHVGNPKYASMPASQLSRIAQAHHTNRCILTLRYIHKYNNVPGVLKFFVQQQWISRFMAQELLTELVPRPTKRTPNAHSAVGQLLLDPAYSSLICRPVLKDWFGNIVDTQEMKYTEEFCPSDDEDTSNHHQ